jgi:predicted AAA+ superfamily ATPase
MYREQFKSLQKWKKSVYRKPLLLQGIRQVGKTWLLKEFGRLEYTDVAYFNLDENIDLVSYFETTRDPDRILEQLSFLQGKRIVPEKTLIILDEIQESNSALNSLKYFLEKKPEYHIAATGSFLGIALSRPSSFPVGKVNFMNLYPMSFEEFLLAGDNRGLVDYLNSLHLPDTIPDIFFNPLMERFKQYLVTGGMPAVVRAWTEFSDIEAVNTLQSEIITSYERDFSKHSFEMNVARVWQVWESIPSQLARENKKFSYSVVKSGARARSYEDAIAWLANSGLIYKVPKLVKPGLPIGAYDDLSAFKVYLMDVGILRKKAGLSGNTLLLGNQLFTEFKGSLMENYVLQELIIQVETAPRYWTSQATAEVDFIIQHENRIYPV